MSIRHLTRRTTVTLPQFRVLRQTDERTDAGSIQYYNALVICNHGPQPVCMVGDSRPVFLLLHCPRSAGESAGLIYQNKHGSAKLLLLCWGFTPNQQLRSYEDGVVQSKDLTGDIRQTKQFCFLDADCLVVGESQSSSRRSAGRYPVKPPHPEGDSHPVQELLNSCFFQ